MTELVNTVELQWLEHLWVNENIFETGVVRAKEYYSLLQVRRHNRDTYSIFFNLEVSCVYSLESPHRGDSNEYTRISFSIRRSKITLNYPKSVAMGFF